MQSTACFYDGRELGFPPFLLSKQSLLYADIQQVQNLVENWDYREMEHIRIGNFRPGPDGGYAITDGNHRSVALALLLATDSITYQPVTAITAITQDQTRHRVYEDEYSQTC